MTSFDHEPLADFDDRDDDDSQAEAAPVASAVRQELATLYVPALHPRAQTAGCGLRRRQRGRTGAFDVPGFMGEYFQEWRDRMPPGWHGLLAETLRKLEAVIDIERDVVPRPWRKVVERLNFFADLTPEETMQAIDITDDRREDLKMMTLTDTGIAMEFDGSLFATQGRVLEGILRKAAAASRCTCRQCGDVGKARQWIEDAMRWDVVEDRMVPVQAAKNAATLCARCFAPIVLRLQLKELYRQVVQAHQQHQPVRQAQLPPAMRRSFLMEAREDCLRRDDLEEGWDDPALEWDAFCRWAGGWLEIGETLRLREIHR